MNRTTTAMLTNKSLCVAVTMVFLILGAALVTPLVSSYEPEAMDFTAIQSAPSWQHWFGTDQVGRDLFLRSMLGAQVSYSVALIATLVALSIGVPWGLTAGYAGGRLDMLMMRIVDALYGLPVVLIVILLVVVFGRNQYLLFAALGAFFWLDIARIVRGQTLRLRQAEFVSSAKLLGANKFHILAQHILPNVAGPIVVYATLALPGIILAESFISFLGLGVQEPDTSWGVLIADGIQTVESTPWLVLCPGTLLAISVWCFNTIGDQLNSIFEVRSKG